MLTASATAAVISQSKPAVVPSRSIDVSRISPAPRDSASRAHSTASRAASAVPLARRRRSPSSAPLGVDGDDDRLAAVAAGQRGDQLGSRSAAVFRLTLSAPASTAAAASSSDRMPPPTVSGRKISRATALMVRASACRRLERRRDVEHDDLVDALDVVAPGELRRIAGVPQLLELHALDDLAVAHVHAGDDALGQHRHPRDLARKLREEFCRARVARLLRVELHAEDVVALDRGGKRVARASWTPTQSAVTGAAYECVKYTCGAGLEPRAAAASAPRRDVERVPADVRHLQPPAGVALQPLHAARQARRGRAPPAPRRCPRTATACRRRCRAAACPGSTARADRVAPRPVERLRWPRSGRRPGRSGRPRRRTPPASRAS